MGGGRAVEVEEEGGVGIGGGEGGEGHAFLVPEWCDGAVDVGGGEEFGEWRNFRGWGLGFWLEGG